MKDLEKILKSLANRRRLEILRLLRKAPAPVFEIAENINLSYRATSRHLNTLYAANVLDRKQIQHEVYYSLRSDMSSLVKFVMTQIH